MVERRRRVAAHSVSVTPSYPRKRDQAVVFEGTMMPRGHDVGRPCDRSGCGREAAELIGQDGGSILFVCAQCANELTQVGLAAREPVADEVADTQEIPVVAETGERSPGGERRGSGFRIPAPCWWFLVGVVLLVVGLNVCAYTASDGLGRGVGVAGGILCARCLVPRHRS